jgi:hypothetical protein
MKITLKENLVDAKIGDVVKNTVVNQIGILTSNKTHIWQVFSLSTLKYQDWVTCNIEKFNGTITLENN